MEKNTLSVTKEMMIEHGKAVVNNTKRSLVVIDLPLEPMKVQKKLLKSCRNFIKTGEVL